MIRVLAMYRHHEGVRFDYGYYLSSHIPMVLEKLAPYGLKSIDVEKGIGGMAPGAPPEFVTIAALNFETLEGFQCALSEKAPEILADIPNYTDAQMQLQVNEPL